MSARTWNQTEAARLHAFGYRPPVAPAATEVCVGCGCSDERACLGGCWWVARELCSNCYAPFGGTD